MIKTDVSLKSYSNFKIGGPAKFLIEIKNSDDLINGLKEWREKGNVFVLGDGTNVLFSDEGFNGLVIKNSIKGLELQGNSLIVGAGEKFSDVLNFCIENSLSGLEWAGGLPGTVGGAVRGNAGAFGGETKDNVEKVKSINYNTLQDVERINQKCGFSYRNSVFKSGEGQSEIITQVFFSVQVRDKEHIKDLIYKNIEHRNNKHPLEYPNLGSIFKNVLYNTFDEENKLKLMQFVKTDPLPVIPAAKLIFLAGLSGTRIGDVMISEKHTNFIVNLGNGNASQVKELIGLIKQKIKEQFGVTMDEEIMYI
jgi:UDP-N-acetylmuramate dehydrogenase